MQEKGEAEKLKEIKKSQSVSSEAVAKLTSGLVLEKYFFFKIVFLFILVLLCFNVCFSLSLVSLLPVCASKTLFLCTDNRKTFPKYIILNAFESSEQINTLTDKSSFQ